MLGLPCHWIAARAWGDDLPPVQRPRGVGGKLLNDACNAIELLSHPDDVATLIRGCRLARAALEDGPDLQRRALRPRATIMVHAIGDG